MSGLSVPGAEVVVCERATARDGEVQAPCALCRCPVAAGNGALARAAERSGLIALVCLPCAPDVVRALRGEPPCPVIDLRGRESQNPPA